MKAVVFATDPTDSDLLRQTLIYAVLEIQPILVCSDRS